MRLPASPLRILVYGDSNSDKGHWYTHGDTALERKWPEYLAGKSPDYTVVNMSAGGETVRWIMDASNPWGSMDTRIEDVLQRSGPFDLVCIQLGTNNAKYAASNDPPSYQIYDLDTALADMRELVERIAAHENGHSAAIVIMAPPPTYDCRGWPQEQCLPNANPLKGFTLATQPFMRELSQAFRNSIALPYGLAFFDLFSLFKSNESALGSTDTTQHPLFPDGVHFNDTAHVLVAARVHGFLSSLRPSRAPAGTHASIRRPGASPPRRHFTLRGRTLAPLGCPTRMLLFGQSKGGRAVLTPSQPR